MIQGSSINTATQLVKKKSIKRDKFFPSEDKFIKDLVTRFGFDWEVISKHFGSTRTKRQIRERWQNYLNPENISVFSQREDELLKWCVEKYGQKWAKIALIIGSKSAVQCRNRHRVLMKLKSKNDYLSNSLPNHKDKLEPIAPIDIDFLNSSKNSDLFSLSSLGNNYEFSNLDEIFQNYDYLFNENMI